MKKVGDGTRTLNFLVDTAIIFLLSYLAFKAWNWYVMYWGYTPHNFGWFFAGALFLYYLIFETLFARTPGKWFTYTKVVNSQGKRASFVSILLRTIARLTVVDLFLMPFFGRPLHDFVSGTWVVEA